MPYFKLIAGIDCGIEKSVCKNGYPENCFNCLSKKFSQANILLDIIEAVEQQSEQKRKEMLYKHVWMKYQDIITIRHVIILSRGGLPALNMAVSDLPIDASLISGFIQANVAFSSEELTMMDKINPEKTFYEFEYKHFNILLKNGKKCRICLILDKKANENLKEMLSNFTDIFEDIFEEELQEFQETGDLSALESAKKLIEKSFELNMISPLTVSTTIPPNMFEELPIIQKAIYEIGKDLLKEEPYFFLTRLMDNTFALLGIISKEEILWNIYQMMRENIIIWGDLELQKKDLESKKEDAQKRETVIHKIMETKELEDIIFECQDMTSEEAKAKINSILKKAEISEKSSAYQESLKEYQKALVYAKELNLDDEIGKISFKIIQIQVHIKDLELETTYEQVNKSEKKKNYAIALKYLFQIKDLLTSQNHDGRYDKQIHKIEQRIKKNQNQFK